LELLAKLTTLLVLRRHWTLHCLVPPSAEGGAGTAVGLSVFRSLVRPRYRFGGGERVCGRDGESFESESCLRWRYVEGLGVVMGKASISGAFSVSGDHTAAFLNRLIDST